MIRRDFIGLIRRGFIGLCQVLESVIDDRGIMKKTALANNDAST